MGYPNSAYGMSKIAVTAATRIQQRHFSQDKTQEDIIVNACCPGYVATDMSSFKGHLTIDQGSKSLLNVTWSLIASRYF
jgi:carbonyl reductase 1